MSETEHRIPQELVDMVLSNLGGSYENRETLKSCSLTCRAWVPASRAQFFESVDLEYPKDITSFSGILRQSPCLVRYVRTLGLFTSDPDNEFSYSDEDLDALRTVVASMEHVQRLRLTGSSPGAVRFLDRLGLPRMDSVSEVTFECMLFDNIGVFTRLLASLPNVDDITIESLWAPTPDDGLIPLPVIAPKLRKVWLFDGFLAAYAPLLPSALDHLAILLTTLRDVRHFCGVFHQSNAASSLTTLVLDDYSGGYDVDPNPYEGLLKRCTALKHFKFHGSLLWTVCVMQSAPDNVTHVELTFPQDSMEDFRLLATALNCKHLPRLESVVLHMPNPRSAGDLDAENLLNIFPDLRARGVLTITFGEWGNRAIR